MNDLLDVIEAISVKPLRPGDVVLLRFKGQVSGAQAEHAQDILAAAFDATGVHFVLLDAGMDVIGGAHDGGGE